MASSNQYSSTQYKDDIQTLMDEKLNNMLDYIKVNTFTYNGNPVTFPNASNIAVTYNNGTNDFTFDNGSTPVDIATLNDTTLAGLIDEYNTLDKRYKGTSQAYDVMFENQNTIANIVKTEQERLEQKKELVDASMFEQKRLQSLNESYRQKYNYYIYILIAFILMFVSFIIIGQLSKTFTFIPSTVFDLLYVLTISIAGFYIYFNILDIARRDHMDFSKINVNPPKQLTPEELEKQRASSYGSGINLTPNFCIGADCCNPDPDPNANSGLQSYWNPETGRCQTNDPATSQPSSNSQQAFTMKYDHSYSPIEMKNKSVDLKQYKSFNTIDHFEYV